MPDETCVFISNKALSTARAEFHGQTSFDHCTVDKVFKDDLAAQPERELGFPANMVSSEAAGGESQPGCVTGFIG